MEVIDNDLKEFLNPFCFMSLFLLSMALPCYRIWSQDIDDIYKQVTCFTPKNSLFLAL